ncbi:Phosphate regulon sensor protein PhoR [Hyphomicrobiales bacterium]|nr:Phosphate regulon sensor protein PhoR [Hyphomicrobiales bacterium]CAH1699347.1 Phosphate regulon sensor protein PhoR [Hyphomicrobiales bacterium]CAI0343135.1 two-component system, OmpR family, phosphate regulon sensor histidine kinase PhoR [Hyphomicrobiales bacterium]
MVDTAASNAATTRTLIEALGAPVVLLDAQGVAQALSPAMRALVPGLEVGKFLALVLRDPDLNDAIEQVAHEGAAKTVELVERVPFERAFRIHIAALGEEGRRRATLLTFQDLSEQRVVERMRVDFVANASHELRTPLASLLGFVETLQGPARNDERARERFLGIMREQGLRMARLVDDLLSLSRIEQRAHVAPDTAVDLAGIAREIVDSLALMAREREVTLVLNTPREPLQVPGDRDELLRLMENLVENAIKYGKQGGEVVIGVEAGETEASVHVRDDGPGIAPEHLPRLTERFYRVDTAASREAGGTGLGLAIVKHIVLRHRGRLTIESKPGEGATFKAILPRFEAGRAAG